MPLPRKQDMGLLYLHMVREFSQDEMDHLISGMSSFVETEHTRLAAHTEELRNDPPEEADADFVERFHEDDHYFLEEAKKLSEELAIVALYKKVEITSKSAIKAAFEDADPSDFFQIKKLKAFLNGKGINIGTLPSFAAMDEVRCINNSIKHSGVVSDELAEYSGWTEGQPLAGLGAAYYRLAPKCGDYIGELVNELIKKRKAALNIP